MNTKLPLIVSIAAVALLCSTALAADNRFDGIWVGTETVMQMEGRGQLHSEPYAVNKPAKIAITRGGTLLGVLDGYGPGRYENVRRVGNTIVFQAGNRAGQLSLSADGNTMIEKGYVPRTGHLNAGQREGALSGHQLPIQVAGVAEVTGIFHRAK